MVSRRWISKVVAILLTLGLVLTSCAKPNDQVSVDTDVETSQQETSETTQSTEADKSTEDSSSTAESTSSTTSTEPTGLSKLESQLGSLAIEANDENNDPVMSEDTLRKIFTIELMGNTYILPCPVKELLNNGWEPGHFSAEGKTTAFMSGWGGIPLNYKGDSDMKITIDVLNLSEGECSWDECFFTGLNVYASSGVSVSSKAGFGLDSTFDDVVGLMGANESSAVSKFEKSANIAMYIQGEGRNALVAYASFDGNVDSEELKHLQLSIANMQDNPLLNV